MSSLANQVPILCVRDSDQSLDLYIVLPQVSAKLMSMKGLHVRLKEIQDYLHNVVEGKLPPNHDIFFQLQVMPLAALMRSGSSFQAHLVSGYLQLASQPQC